MRAVQTRYAVPGWGLGELWTLDGVVLAHELEFDSNAGGTAPGAGVSNAAASRSNPGSSLAGSVALANPPEGAQGPPSGTVPTSSARVGHGFAPESQQRDDSTEDVRNVRLDPDELVARLTAFLAGEDVSLADVPIDLTWCTPFQHRIALTLRAVPRGEVVSYGELAALAGNPGAARAVGTFCARNRFMLLVPCHRVVAAAGIGGYGSAGTGVKSRLLALEGVRL